MLSVEIKTLFTMIENSQVELFKSAEGELQTWIKPFHFKKQNGFIFTLS